MTSSPQTIVLASRSPRRLELLRRIGVEPIVCPADVDESPFLNEVPISYVSRISKCKAETVAHQFINEIVLAADTTVELDGVIFGQPVDDSDARRMLSALSAKTHNVHTAVSVLRPGVAMRTVVVTSQVTFIALNPHIIEWYLATGEPRGKAGAYAVQGAGGVLVKHVRGSMSNVVGLPLREALEDLWHELWGAKV
ncbi:MAG: septum formation protein Maf [Ilumatobacteraceae bacterium]|nr:septum formation protein Maf [Ilumatobacteraceae bacterium]